MTSLGSLTVIGKADDVGYVIGAGIVAIEQIEELNERVDHPAVVNF